MGWIFQHELYPKTKKLNTVIKWKATDGQMFNWLKKVASIKSAKALFFLNIFIQSNKNIPSQPAPINRKLMGLKKQASPVLKRQIIYQQLELEDCFSKMELIGDEINKCFCLHWTVSVLNSVCIYQYWGRVLIIK